MDAMRKQLDVLMGANRNGDVEEVSRNYYDRDVCRLFLAGLCPHDLFQLTKMDLGPCSKVHSLQLRKDYEQAKSKGSENFDRELEDVIERLIVECDRKIQRALKRLADEDAKAAIAISVSEVTLTDEILQLSKEIKQKMKEADEFDFEGKSDDKIKTLELVEELRSKRADMQATLLLDAFNKDRASLPQPTPAPQITPVPPLAPPDARTQEMINEKLKKAEELGEQGMVDEAQKALEEAEALKRTDQKLCLCDICGAFLSVYDNDRCLADHFGGKLHLGYMLIREKLKELQKASTEFRKFQHGPPPYLSMFDDIFHGVAVDGSTSYVLGEDDDKEEDDEEEDDDEEDDDDYEARSQLPAENSSATSGSRKRGSSTSTSATSLAKKSKSPIISVFQKMLAENKEAHLEKMHLMKAQVTAVQENEKSMKAKLHANLGLVKERALEAGVRKGSKQWLALREIAADPFWMVLFMDIDDPAERIEFLNNYISRFWN